MVETPPSSPAAWQLTLATVVTVGGFFINAAIAGFNAQRTGAVKRLDHFNNVVRRPIELRLEKIDACCDDAEDYWREPKNPPLSLDQLSRNFHGARRALERTLQDAQSSDLVPGDDWLQLKDDECDRAVDALEEARAASVIGDTILTEARLRAFRDLLILMRRRLQSKIDTESHKAMAFRFGWW